MRTVLITCLLAIVGLSGCASDPVDTEADADEPMQMPPEAEQMAQLYAVAVDMAYRPTSVWQFYPGTLSAPANEMVNLTLKSAGGNQYAHDLVIDELDIRLVVPGEFDTDSVVFEAPAGTYAFYCSITGHRLLGMEGTLTVS